MELCRATAELNRYEMEQDRLDAAADEVEERITDRADDLIQRGSECYPFSPDNFAEALGEIDTADIADLFARGARLDAGNLLDTRVREYWAKTAIVIATKQIESEE